MSGASSDGFHDTDQIGAGVGRLMRTYGAKEGTKKRETQNEREREREHVYARDVDDHKRRKEKKREEGS